MKELKTPKTSFQNVVLYLWQNTNCVFWLLLGFALCVVIYALRSILLPFVAGIVLAYLLDPLATRLEKLKISRLWATILVFVIAVLILAPLFVWLCYLISNQINVLISSVPAYAAALSKKAGPLLDYLQAYFPSLEVENIKSMLSKNTENTLRFGGKLLKGVFENTMAIVNVLSLVLIAPIVAFYLLRDWKVMAQKIKDLLPRKHKKEILQIFGRIDEALSGFIRGQLSVCVILGTYYAIGLKLTGLDLGLLIGFIAGVISFIPYVGSITGFVLSMILAFSEFNDMTHIAAVVAVFVLGQFIEGNFLTPKLVGDKVGLHPVWVMFAILAGGALMGFSGLLIAVPLAAVIGVLLRYGLQKYKKSSLYTA